MIIPVILNDSKVLLDADPSLPLLDVLREKKLFSVKEGCRKGLCGCCTVLINEKPSPACKIPVGILRDCRIVTLEHFSKSEDYKDIISGFETAGISMCGYCNASKIFSVYEIFSEKNRPDKQRLTKLAENLTCSCTEKNTYISGVLYAVANNHKRKGTKKDD